MTNAKCFEILCGKELAPIARPEHMGVVLATGNAGLCQANMDMDRRSLNEPRRPGVGRRKEESGTGSEILSARFLRGLWHQKHFSLRCEEMHLPAFRLPASPVAGRRAKLVQSPCGVCCGGGKRAASLRLSRATSPRAQLPCRLPRPHWGRALPRLTQRQEKGSVPSRCCAAGSPAAL